MAATTVPAASSLTLALMAAGLAALGGFALRKQLISAATIAAVTLAAIASIPLLNPGITARAQTTDEVRERAVSLRGKPSLATLNYTGTMEIGSDGKLAGGSEKFKLTRIKTSKNPDKWLKVVSFSIGKDGDLVVKDELGASYSIKIASKGSTGAIEELPSWRPASH